MHVLGAGAVGCLWSSRLALAGAAPTLLLRQGSPKVALRAPCGAVQLSLESAAEREAKVVEVPAQVIGESGKSKEIAPIRTLLVATKAYDTVAALESVASRLAPDAVLVLLSNGALALAEQVRASPTLSGAHAILGITTHGAWARDHFQVVHAGVGRTWLGRSPDSALADPRYLETLAQLRLAGLGASDAGAGILGHLWRKLATNAVINPLTALWEAPNGEVLRREEGIVALREVCREIGDLASALHTGSSPDSAAEVPSAQDLEAFVRSVAEETAGNQSSMLRDVLAGRATEIDFLNGWVAAKGRELGLPVPATADLAERVREKERAAAR